MQMELCSAGVAQGAPGPPKPTARGGAAAGRGTLRAHVVHACMMLAAWAVLLPASLVASGVLRRVVHGATTAAEATPRMASWCALVHAWSAHPAHMISCMRGSGGVCAGGYLRRAHGSRCMW
jgi:hypothetical protein